MKEPISEEMIEEHLDNPNRCPYCWYSLSECRDVLEDSNGRMNEQWRCYNCHRTWECKFTHTSTVFDCGREKPTRLA